MAYLRLQHYIGLPSDIAAREAETDYHDLDEIMSVFEGDAFRVMHHGTNKVVVFRKNEVLVYTEE